MTVNHGVLGSSPRGGAGLQKVIALAITFFLFYSLQTQNPSPFINDSLFIPLNNLGEEYVVPLQFELLGENNHPSALCKLAAEDLQRHLNNQTTWKHNFGLEHTTDSPIVGKMFGVLVVQNEHKQIGYIAAFSGKMAGKNILKNFVPPVFDNLEQDGFLTRGMEELSRITAEVKMLQDRDDDSKKGLESLLTKRKNYSNALQNQLYNAYAFLNRRGEEKSLVELFNDAHYKNPPSGAGECAGPKLLQYAFKNNLKPLALAEFWWGLSPKSTRWQHGEYYPCCKEKCAPILAHMLVNING